MIRLEEDQLLLSGDNKVFGSILPAVSSMLSEEGACCPHRNSLLQNNQPNKGSDGNIKAKKRKTEKTDGSVQRDYRHTDQTLKARPVVWSVELEYYQVEIGRAHV